MKPVSLSKKLLLPLALIFSLTTFSQSILVPFGATWKYLDNGTDQGTAWIAPAPTFNDASWAAGPAELGYGNADEATVVSYGSDPNNKYITTYFRKTVTIANPSGFTNFTFNVKYDDGFVLFINGVEIRRERMPAGSILFNTLANSPAVNNATVSFDVANTSFAAGDNIIAVEIHQLSNTSSDISFDLQLIGNLTPTTIIGLTDTWKYLDNGSDQGTAWRAAAFNDGAWVSGLAELGYGDGGEGTVVSHGGCTPIASCGPKYITTYFRKTFNITGINNYANFTFSLYRDDGAIVYINGQEVYTSNISSGAGYMTTASSATDDGNTAQVFNLTLCNSFLVEGSNTIAVEIHQTSNTSSDMSFNLGLVANPGATGGTPVLTRNPYLQMGRETAITIRWRTDIACIGRVELGTAFGTYTTATADEGCATTEHEVTVTGLTPDTKYFYSIGTDAPLVLQATTNNFFTTLPPASTTRKLRFAVFGDCGRNDNGFQTGSLAQYQRYLSDNSIDAADAMLLLGDNAYTNGTETEYINNFFTPFGSSILRNHKLYPAPGNHDYYGTSTTSRSGAYYQNFTMPTNAEIGGVASGTEAFYSYDIGDVHFLSLDSYGEESGATKLYDTLGAQVTWIKADLAANTKKWVVAYWHHPPYTKGSHDSDTETDLRDIRENFIRILERNGVDMILCGHSHDYERSYLLKGYYKTNPGDAALNGVNFNVNTHAVNNSSGRYNGTANSCTYTTTSGKVHHGTVYVLSGSSGANGGVVGSGTDPWPHNALPFAIDEGGMFYFEVDNNRLDAKFISRIAGGGGAPIIEDQFTIMKDVNVTSNLNVVNGNSINLTASWPQSGNYTWTATPGTTRTVNVTPPNSATTVYTVSDGLGCVTDQFSVTASGTLPVSLLNYNVKLNNKKVDITWSTTSEVNNNYFSIERSANGVDYIAIGRVNGAGTTNTLQDYSFVDNDPILGVSYYRLTQTNHDDRKEYLGVKQIINNKGIDYELKAIALGSGKLRLQINSSSQSTYQVRIIDMLGRTRKNEMINCAAGVCNKEFLLEPGVFVYEVVDSKSVKISEKVLIN